MSIVGNLSIKRLLHGNFYYVLRQPNVSKDCQVWGRHLLSAEVIHSKTAMSPVRVKYVNFSTPNI